MGQSIFIMALREARFIRTWLAGVFDRDALEPSRLLSVEYADGFAEIYCTPEREGDIHRLSLMKFGGRTALDRIFEIMDKVPRLAVWSDVPGGGFGAVTRRAFLSMMPPDHPADHGRPAVVRNVRELSRLLRRDYDTEYVTIIRCG